MSVKESELGITANDLVSRPGEVTATEDGADIVVASQAVLRPADKVSGIPALVRIDLIFPCIAGELVTGGPCPGCKVV